VVKYVLVSKILDSTISEEYVLVDDEDFEKCQNIEWKWYEHSAYVYTIMVSGKKVFLNRYIMDLDYEENNRMVIFKNPEDNTNYSRSNLQVVDRSYISRNVSKTWGKSKYKGVSWDSGRKKWKAVVRRKGKTLFSKSFDDEEKAAEAYINAVKEIDGKI